MKKILLGIEEKMKNGELKPTLGDYIRLLQLNKEMGDQTKTEIKVTWIEEPETSIDE